MVISALSPKAEMFNSDLYEEDRSLLFKLLLMLEDKCPWFSTHFKTLAVDMPKIRQEFMAIICKDSNALRDRKSIVKQFEFLKSPESELEEKQSKQKKYSGDWSSSSNSD